MTEQYIIIVRYNGELDSEWVHVDYAKHKAKELRDRGIDCDIYSKVIE